MPVERDDDGLQVTIAGQRVELRENSAVPEMHAVEFADRDGTGPTSSRH